MDNLPKSAHVAWFHVLEELLASTSKVAPRGQPTVELLQHTMLVDMMRPTIMSPTRNVSEKFYGAEAYWILTGDDRVETLAPYNKNIAQFSDDGQIFFGAYGPKIQAQLPYVVAKLLEDPYSRQAGLNIWRENPPATKDVPCTISMFFSIRQLKLHSHVFMRSSDVWLGVPYDVFNFSMVAYQLCCRLNAAKRQRMLDVGVVPTLNMEPWWLSPGTLHLTAANRHLYMRNYDAARDVLTNDARYAPIMPAPQHLYVVEEALLEALNHLRLQHPRAQWWQP